MRKKIIRLFLTAIILTVAVIVGCYVVVSVNAKGRTYDNIEDVPYNKVGLLLATSPITPAGAHNFYFDNRIKAADELYKAGKVDYIITSGGDYSRTQNNGCDEPKAILDSLVARGVPADRIILDYDGTRTINSIAKAKEVYGLDSLTLISQKYHNERAIYLADKYGIYAVGYNAEPSSVCSSRVKNTLREYLARVKMFIDIFKGSNADTDSFSYMCNQYDSVYIKYNHHRHISCYVTEHRLRQKEIYRLHWYYICCGDTIYSYECDDVAKPYVSPQFCDSMIKMVEFKYPPYECRHRYFGIHSDIIINMLNNYVTVESYEYNKDSSYGNAPHGDGVYEVYSYDISGYYIALSEIINIKKTSILESLLIDKFVEEKNRVSGVYNDTSYNNKLCQQLKDAGLNMADFAIGENGLLYSFDYNDGDVIPICYADRFLIEIPYSSIQNILTSEFRRMLKIDHEK